MMKYKEFEVIGDYRKFVRHDARHEAWAWWLTNDVPNSKPICYGLERSEALANKAATEAISRHNLLRSYK